MVRVIKSCEQVRVDHTVILDIRFTIDALYAIYDFHTYSQEHRTTFGSPESWSLEPLDNWSAVLAAFRVVRFGASQG